MVQKVEIPQVPPKEPPESGSQIPFGKPHAPRAMPFAPFDPYTPHTAPYIEPDAEAARLLGEVCRALLIAQRVPPDERTAIVPGNTDPGALRGYIAVPGE